MAATFELQRIDHVALLVRDVERSVSWYRDVLGLDRDPVGRAAWGNFPAVVGRGGTSLALFPVGVPSPKPPPGPDTLCVRHVAFRADRANFLRAQEELARRGIAFEFEDHGVAHSIYLEDPDGHRLEVTTYDLPPGPAGS